VVRAMGTPGGPRAQPCHGLPQVALGVPHHALDSRRFTPWMGPHVLDCQGACLPWAHPRGLHPTNPLQILRLPGLWDRALKGMHRIPTGLPVHPIQGPEGLVHGMSGPRGTFSRRTLQRGSFKDLRRMQVSLLSERGKGLYPSDYSQAFAFCKILYPLAYGFDCSRPSPVRPRRETRERTLKGPSKRGIEPCSRRAYPVHDETRGEFHPSRP